MRVTNIVIYSNDVEMVNFSLRDADPTARYMIKVIEGLDAEELVPKFYGVGTTTGKKFHEFGTKARELNMRLVLNPRFVLRETYSDIRDEIYRAISSSRSGSVDVYFMAAGTTVAKLTGFVTRLEADHFAKEPEVRLQITCEDAMFRGVVPVVKGPDDIVDVNPFVFGDTVSTAPHGFQFEIEFTATVASFVVNDAENSDWTFTLTPASSFLSGDRLVFSSEFGNSQLYMVRSAVTTHLMDRVVPGSAWPIIFPGANAFNFVSRASFDWVSVSWYPAYWGV